MFHHQKHIANLDVDGYPSFRTLQSPIITRYQINPIPRDQILPIPTESVPPNFWTPEEVAQHQRSLSGYYPTSRRSTLYTLREHSEADSKIRQSLKADTDLLSLYVSENYSSEEKCLLASVARPVDLLHILATFPSQEQRRKEWIAEQLGRLRRQKPNRAEVFKAKERMMGLVTETIETEPSHPAKVQSTSAQRIENVRDTPDNDNDSESEGGEDDAEAEDDCNENHDASSGASICCSTLTEIPDDDQSEDEDKQSDNNESEEECVSEIADIEESEDEEVDEDENDDEEYDPVPRKKRRTTATGSYTVAPPAANRSQSAEKDRSSSISPADCETVKPSAKRKRDHPAYNNTSADGETPKKEKREKCAVSCERCKSLKKKCQGGFPCTYCMAAAEKAARQNGGKLSLASWGNRKGGGKKEKPPPWCVILPEYGIPDSYTIALDKPYFVLAPEAAPALNAALEKRRREGIPLKRPDPKESAGGGEEQYEGQALPEAGEKTGEEVKMKKGYSKSGKKLGRPIKNKTAS